MSPADGHTPVLRARLCILVGGHDNVDNLRGRTKVVKSLSQPKLTEHGTIAILERTKISYTMARGNGL